MRLDRFFRPRRISIILVLVLSIFGLALTLGPVAIVHGAGPSLVQAFSAASLQDGAVIITSPQNVISGDFLMLHSFCMAGSGGLTGITDSQTNTWTNLITNSRGTIWDAIVKTTGTDTLTVTYSGCNFSGSPAGTFGIEEFTGVGSLGNNNKQLGCTGGCTDTITLTIGTNNALIYEGFDVYGGGLSSCPTITNGGSSQVTTFNLVCLNGLASAWSDGRTTYAANRGIGINSLSMTTSASQSTGHEVVELDPPGGAPTNLGQQTACYGNCGNPAITLVNTNSTHTVNFNQTLTLFYQFQSQLNGQVLNVTTNVAKTYSNGIAMTIGVYTIPACSPGQPPFSAICPGLLQKSTTITNPLKGRQTANNLGVPVSSGQWVGIAITAQFNGLDINDTNTGVILLQSFGTMPPSISIAQTLNAASLVGLWAYITGNTITGVPPPPLNGGGNCSGLLDCIIPNWVFSLCTNQTPACQNGSALLWAGGLAIFFMFFTVRGVSNLAPNVKVPIGEIFTFWLLIWIFIMSGLQLLFVWVPLFFFFVISIAAGKHYGKFL